MAYVSFVMHFTHLGLCKLKCEVNLEKMHQSLRDGVKKIKKRKWSLLLDRPEMELLSSIEYFFLK